MENIIVGRNPVMEALKGSREIEKILAIRDGEGSLKKILSMARDQGIQIQYVDKVAIDRLAGKNNQGVAAYISMYDYCTPDDLIELAESKGEKPLLIILDGIEDPHNLGAIIRSADGAGAHGIIIPKRRSASVTETVAKSSAGAVEYVKIAKVSNLVRTIEELKEKGFWIAACDVGGEIYHKANLKGNLALVVGSEGQGISRLVKEKCDFIVSIPMAGNVNSLNASNAAAILLYEINRQRSLEVIDHE